jgi:hypothetical protein
MTENTSAVALSSTQSVATLADLRRFLDLLHAQWHMDPEVGHSVNDEIRKRVLEMCAEGHPQAAELAREVLVTDTWDDIEVWCA